MPTVQARAMRRAAEVCGEENLAGRLGVTVEQLQLWMRGIALPPDDIFLQLVDIIWDDAVEELKRESRAPTTPDGKHP